MEYNLSQIKRITVSILLAIYGLAITLVLLFALMWDNKGAKSMWDKSIQDWQYIVWLAAICFIVWFSVYKCLSTVYTSTKLIVALFLIAIINLYLVEIWSYSEASLYLGTPHFLLFVGLYLWWDTINHEITKP